MVRDLHYSTYMNKTRAEIIGDRLTPPTPKEQKKIHLHVHNSWQHCVKGTLMREHSIIRVTLSSHIIQ